MTPAEAHPDPGWASRMVGDRLAPSYQPPSQRSYMLRLMGSGSVVVAILSHRDPPLLHRLVDRVLEGERTVAVVHHDPRGEPHGLQESDRVRLVPDPAPCDWGRMSQAVGMYRCISAARALVPDVEWALLISGQDYPAQSLSATERFLADSNADALLRYFEVSPTPQVGETAWQSRCRERYLRRIRVPFSRRSVPGVRRQLFGEAYPLYIGDTWVNLRRPAIDHLVDQFGRHADVRSYLSRCSNPDEALIPTLLLNGQTSLRVISERRRYIRWVEGRPHPETLDSSYLDAIRDSGDFFARKVDSVVSATLLDHLDAIQNEDTIR